MRDRWHLTHMKSSGRYTKCEWRNWRVGKFQRIADKVTLDLGKKGLERVHADFVISE